MLFLAPPCSWLLLAPLCPSCFLLSPPGSRGFSQLFYMVVYGLPGSPHRVNRRASSCQICGTMTCVSEPRHLPKKQTQIPTAIFRAAASCSFQIVRLGHLARPGSSWLLLAPPGSWLLVAPPGSSWVLLDPASSSGSSMFLLALPGSSWLLYAPPGSSMYWGPSRLVGTPRGSRSS